MKNVIKKKITNGELPLHLKSIQKKSKPKYLTKVKSSKILKTSFLQLSPFYKSSIWRNISEIGYVFQ